jgi:hypothetical protein
MIADGSPREYPLILALDSVQTASAAYRLTGKPDGDR